MSRPFNNLTGQTFGHLTAVEFVGRDKFGHAQWLCHCDCGNQKTVYAQHLRKGDVHSCGCASSRQLFGNVAKRVNTRHGQWKSRTYKSWTAMKHRCGISAQGNNAKYYRERGIEVDTRWEVFANFLEDMGERPPGTSIDRVDNNGPYAPWNCRWATPKEQVQNRRPPISKGP